MRRLRKDENVRRESHPSFYSNHTCEPAAVTMETRRACSEPALSQGRQFLKKTKQNKNPNHNRNPKL